ncbi:nucleotidyltransferase family protein [Alienimonas californiensis]|uniref:Nicotine blue oxidoreductase n=1 Tax=Alienimonas californiensis TaxID=2527989 RepID=A0A517PDI0_9PLAN|nr:nucleotidyltransferase family protein [Alienimonas californiensis]QDT17437.1 Nicotine blue oxidoreductase [Alienimonas californiensis]
MSRPGPPQKLEPVDDCAAIVLAAGGASRFGSPKPLAPWGDDTLLGHAVAVAEAAGCWPIVAVVGCEAAAVARAVPAAAAVAINPRWAAGQGTSLAAGFEALAGGQEPSRTLILPVDLPRIEADDLRRIIDASKADGAVAAAASFPDGAGGEAFGPPVCVTPSLYPALRACTPEGGAKPFLAELGDGLVRVPLPAAADDVDTPADLAAAQSAASP